MNRRQRQRRVARARQHQQRTRSNRTFRDVTIDIEPASPLTLGPVVVSGFADELDLLALRRDELAEVARQHGMAVKTKTTKAQMAEFILATAA